LRSAIGGNFGVLVTEAQQLWNNVLNLFGTASAITHGITSGLSVPLRAARATEANGGEGRQNPSRWDFQQEFVLASHVVIVALL